MACKMDEMLNSGQFHLFMQTKHDAENGKIIGAESLSRFTTHDGENVMPDMYIWDMEDDKSITELDFHILDMVCAFLSQWQNSFGSIEMFTISVNFSKTTLCLEDFCERFCSIVNSYDIEHKYIEVEITEPHRFSKTTPMQANLERLRKDNFFVSIDDYGKCSSAFSIIRHVDIDTLKIDRELVVECLSKEKTFMIFEAVVNLAKKLGISVVAEGVETPEQLRVARAVGCDTIQGWYYSRALPISEFVSFVKEYMQKYV